MMNTILEFLKIANSKKEIYSIVPVKIEDFIFESRVKFNCFYCGKYNNCWKCPPKLPDLDYKQMFSEYDNAAFVYGKYEFDESNYQMVRNESSVLLHKTMLSFEKYLWNHNNSLAISFIGGSCKLCKNGCGKERCNNPYMARSPLEATGVNIVETAKKYGIEIIFPPKDYIIRLGMILW